MNFIPLHNEESKAIYIIPRSQLLTVLIHKPLQIPTSLALPYTHQFTQPPIPWSLMFLTNLTVTNTVKIFTACYDIRTFNTMMRSLSWISCNTSLLQLISSHPRILIVCPSGLSTTNLLTTILCVFLICPLRVTCTSHLFNFHLITIIGITLGEE